MFSAGPLVLLVNHLSVVSPFFGRTSLFYRHFRAPRLKGDSPEAPVLSAYPLQIVSFIFTTRQVLPCLLLAGFSRQWLS